ncbi:hypothetical protein SLE2022_406260 [Rubroshorea leprosula]
MVKTCLEIRAKIEVADGVSGLLYGSGSVSWFPRFFVFVPFFWIWRRAVPVLLLNPLLTIESGTAARKGTESDPA